jgi:hypothetical protein
LIQSTGFEALQVTGFQVSAEKSGLQAFRKFLVLGLGVAGQSEGSV